MSRIKTIEIQVSLHVATKHHMDLLSLQVSYKHYRDASESTGLA
jgi:hypothetical protein